MACKPTSTVGSRGIENARVCSDHFVKDELSQLCQASREETSGADTDDWIECTTCSKWYHSVFVGHPPTEGD
ncbi:hypothetical protein UPYG_G00137320 [Umbra pygmaea]|uniref:Uncharacterized protein n=1 Tax=Umbra pygmaea TaxID=75934 RepID=A0ABD0XF94_UMBPY